MTRSSSTYKHAIWAFMAAGVPGKVDGGAGGGLDGAIAMELGAVVGGDLQYGCIGVAGLSTPVSRVAGRSIPALGDATLRPSESL